MRRVLAALIGIALCFGSSIQAVFAYTYRDFDALLLSVSSPSTLAPGETATVSVAWKNTGVAAWSATGKNFVALYGWNASAKTERVSAFRADGWETGARAWRLPKTTAAGASVTASFVIQAPQTPGVYHESFILASEDTAWIKLSAFTLDITVKGNSTPVAIVEQPAPAAATRAAHVTRQSGREWQLNTGERTQVELEFTNTGTVTWAQNTDEAVWLHAVDGGSMRSSVFRDSGWAAASRVAKPIEGMTRPNGSATFKFWLTAPKKQGQYQEAFALGNAAGTRWVDGSRVVLPIRVVGQDEFIATAPPDDAQAIGTTPSASSGGGGVPAPTGPVPTATLLLKSLSSMTVSGNGRQSMTFGWKNTGTQTWNARTLRFVSVSPDKGKNGRVRDDSWGSSTEIARYTEPVKPGEIGFFTFALKGPARKGTYTATLQVSADGADVAGGGLEIPITVTADGYLEPETPVSSPSTPYTPSTPNAPSQDALSIIPLTVAPLGGSTDALPSEPIIRVGLFPTTDDRMVIRAKYVPVIVTNGGATVCTLAIGASASVQFDRGRSQYILGGGTCAGTSATPFLFRANDGISAIELSDFNRPVGWLPGSNDNTFRSQLELRYAPATNVVWVINELPIEWYLKGIAETSNSSPPQFQRTLITTARTYAMYHVLRGTKHANEFYTVDARYDQLYRGYGAESRDPNVAVAVDATRGQIVTYNEALAITPYFSRSDGRTRSWGEVWYGQSRYPWLISVPVPQDAGKTLWGHGVGMSASGALAMANEGKTYDQILTYFYTGVQLRRAYK